MNRQELVAALLSTADDARLSRGERTAVRAVLEEASPAPSVRRAVANDLVDAVADRFAKPELKALVGWLGDVLPLLLLDEEAGDDEARAWFGPGDPMVETILSFLASTRRSVDIAVFTITDDRITEALLALHRRGLRVRILTDDDKSWDRGSDVRRLSDAGIAVRQDRSEHHFHHKFAVVDRTRLLNGSYNWTRGADRDNRENFLITTDPRLVERYAAAFDEMWRALA